MLLKKDTAFTRSFFLGSTGLTPALEISKAGAAFAAAAGAVSELSDGWYNVALTAADTDTVGQLAYHFDAGTPADFEDQVFLEVLGDALAADVVGWNGSAVPAMVTGLIPMLLRQCESNSIDNQAMTASACQKVFEAAALNEDYAADGSPATPAQLLYMLWSMLSEFAIAGTTITCKRLDGTTTSMTFTLNSAVSPTSRSRSG